ncbi:MAG: hypothetical protein QNJ97_19625 [Myxococcota bacterium]|nr:hypothetical protein [Myxococcota bacterium]
MQTLWQSMSLAVGLIALAAGCDGAPVASEVGGSTAVRGIHTVSQGPGYLGANRPDKALRLTMKLTTDGVEVLSAVEAANTLNRRDRYASSPAFYRVLDAKDRVVFERGFRLETVIRSETNGPDGQIEGHFFELKEPVFRAVVPLFENTASIQFYRVGGDGSRESATLLGEVRP